MGYRGPPKEIGGNLLVSDWRDRRRGDARPNLSWYLSGIYSVHTESEEVDGLGTSVNTRGRGVSKRFRR